jgi:hypothetical protein
MLPFAAVGITLLLLVLGFFLLALFAVPRLRQVQRSGGESYGRKVNPFDREMSLHLIGKQSPGEKTNPKTG